MTNAKKKYLTHIGNDNCNNNKREKNEGKKWGGGGVCEEHNSIIVFQWCFPSLSQTLEV